MSTSLRRRLVSAACLLERHHGVRECIPGFFACDVVNGTVPARHDVRSRVHRGPLMTGQECRMPLPWRLRSRRGRGAVLARGGRQTSLKVYNSVPRDAFLRWTDTRCSIGDSHWPGMCRRSSPDRASDAGCAAKNIEHLLLGARTRETELRESVSHIIVSKSRVNRGCACCRQMLAGLVDPYDEEKPPRCSAYS